MTQQWFDQRSNMLLFIVAILSLQAVQQLTAQTTSNCPLAKDCTSCMKAGPECYWCKDTNFTANGNLNRPRCNVFSELSTICSNLTFLNGSIKAIKEDDFSSTIQVSPQSLKMVLRPGQEQKFRVTVQPAENFPVDIYVLMDLSFSMKDDLETISQLTDKIAKAIGNITTNYRLGFGAFIDKPTTPYIPIFPKNFPTCSECRPVFGYVHAFDFSNDSAAFSKALRQHNISGDVDKPEALFDGLMQASVCEKTINWKPKGASRRIIMIVTDALPKSAGDGKTGGIIKPNDEKCYMAARDFLGKTEKYFTKSTEMDYPSIKQLKNVMFEYGITPILAVTEDVLPIYKKIAEEWADLGAAADILSRNSSNIVQLLRDNYNKISTTVNLNDNSSAHINIDYQIDPTSCNNIDSSSSCSNVKLNQSIIFDVTVKLNECPKDPTKEDKLIINTGGFGVITIDVSYLCDCNCAREPKSRYCNYQGTYECGICICNNDFFGHKCLCDLSNPSHNETKPCVDPLTTDGTSCNGFGHCICGKCECFRQPYPREISGKHCECKNFGCPRFNDLDCGGPERGTCKCGNCECKAPYVEANCGKTDCKVVLEKICKDEKGVVCNNNGKCDCPSKKCQCDVGYDGIRCEKCVSPQCKCDSVFECLQCEITNSTCDPSLNCSIHSYYETNDTISNGCTKLVKNCEYIYNITGNPLVKNEPLDILYKSTGKCNNAKLIDTTNDDPNLLAIILGIIAGILLLGLLLLLLWKLLVTMHDKREYARFQKSQSNDSQWEKDGNPIYRDPNQEFVNPAFAGGN